MTTAQARRIKELEAKRDEWKQAAQVEAGLRREFHGQHAALVNRIENVEGLAKVIYEHEFPHITWASVGPCTREFYIRKAKVIRDHLLPSDTEEE